MLRTRRGIPKDPQKSPPKAPKVEKAVAGRVGVVGERTVAIAEHSASVACVHFCLVASEFPSVSIFIKAV